jgi:predicted RNase H-like nuclease (RuvC/YqgF family)
VLITDLKPAATKYSSATGHLDLGRIVLHSHYPTIADAIRQHQERESRAQRDTEHQALKQQRERARELRREIVSLRADVRRLSSINEILLAESAALQSRLGDQKVVALKSLKMVSRASAHG